MKVFLAGASGVIGRRLVPQLLAAGHEVTGMTRSEQGAEAIRAAGAKAALADVFDAEAVKTALADAKPEAVIAELTRLPKDDFNPRTIDYEPTNRVRIEGGRNLIAAARAAAARRYITQSIAFVYAPEGDLVKDEESRVFSEAPPPFRSALEGAMTMEREALEAEGLEGLVLRYGWFYGPGTYYGRGGGTAGMVQSRRFPIVGNGNGVFSFIHVDDAAAATVQALDHGAPGVYNVVDDDPAAVREWLPAYAEALGARRPMRVPKFLGRLAAGKFAAEMMTTLRGASNEKARRELGWTPEHSSWRQGFAASLSEG